MKLKKMVVFNAVSGFVIGCGLILGMWLGVSIINLVV